MSKQSLVSNNSEFSLDSLRRLQNVPMEQKVLMTKRRIKQFYDAMGGRVYISFSGGKDSTVLLHIVRELYPDAKAVFIDTGLEYPEIREFVKTIDNVDWIKSKYTFKETIEKYGYPLPSKEIAEAVYQYRQAKSEKTKTCRMEKLSKGKAKWKFLLESPYKISDQCCHVMKKNPAKKYERENKLHPIIGTMAEESFLRQTSYTRTGCNIYDGKRPKSNPMMFWTEKDVWDYIRKYSIKYSSIYDMGYERTGCMFCMFGLWSEKAGNTRFDKMKITHPKQYEYCMDKLGISNVIEHVTNNLENRK